MATKTAKSATPKATTENAANPEITKQIAGRYADLVNHDGEFSFILHVAELMEQGLATVRSTQEAIASVSGSAPTIRKSHAQWFTIASKIIKTQSGAMAYSVSDILKLSERVGREHGADKSAEVIASAKDMADLEAKAPTQTKSKKGKAKSDKIVPITTDLIIQQTLNALRKVNGKNIASAKTSELDSLRALLAVLVQISKNSEPVKAEPKVKANA